LIRGEGEHVPADARHEKPALAGARQRGSRASGGTTFCRVSTCARLTQRSGLFFYSDCGGSSRIVDFSWLHASMPGQEMSMRLYDPPDIHPEIWPQLHHLPHLHRPVKSSRCNILPIRRPLHTHDRSTMLLIREHLSLIFRSKIPYSHPIM
jgi:hypothetical protein